jgi:spore coat protein A
MRSTRRRFLLQTAALSLGPLEITNYLHGVTVKPRAVMPQLAGLSLNPAALPKFVDALPIPEKARPVRKGHYRIAMREFQAKVHRDLAPTAFWGYEGMSPGPTIEARSGEAITVEWVNDLPAKHLLPIDHALHGAGTDVLDVRTVVHLHGGRTPAESDGDPERWFVPGRSKVDTYPNRQQAAGLFYHDHAMGITRLNAVAGLFGHYLVRDEFEDSLHLPSGPYEIPLCLYERLFHMNGQLQYQRTWIDDYNANAILLNGKIFPFLEVEPRAYRFRILNCSNGSFFTLSFAKDGLSLVPGSEVFQTIGSDQGFLAAPLEMKRLALTPGERADIVMDFGPYAGKTVYLKTSTVPIMQIRVSAAGGEDAGAAGEAARRGPDAGERGGEDARADAGGLQGRGRHDDAYAAERHALRYAGDGEAGVELDRDMDADQPDGGAASDPSASGALPDTGPAAVRCGGIQEDGQAGLPRGRGAAGGA